MKKKKIQESHRLDDCPPDCIGKITNFFCRSRTVFNFALSCRTIFQIIHSQYIHCCENVIFKWKKEICQEKISLKRIVPFVRSLEMNCSMVDPIQRNKGTGGPIWYKWGFTSDQMKVLFGFLLLVPKLEKISLSAKRLLLTSCIESKESQNERLGTNLSLKFFRCMISNSTFVKQIKSIELRRIVFKWECLNCFLNLEEVIIKDALEEEVMEFRKGKITNLKKFRRFDFSMLSYRNCNLLHQILRDILKIGSLRDISLNNLGEEDFDFDKLELDEVEKKNFCKVESFSIKNIPLISPEKEISFFPGIRRFSAPFNTRKFNDWMLKVLHEKDPKNILEKFFESFNPLMIEEIGVGFHKYTTEAKGHVFFFENIEYEVKSTSLLKFQKLKKLQVANFPKLDPSYLYDLGKFGSLEFLDISCCSQYKSSHLIAIAPRLRELVIFEIESDIDEKTFSFFKNLRVLRMGEESSLPNLSSSFVSVFLENEKFKLLELGNSERNYFDSKTIEILIQRNSRIKYIMGCCKKLHEKFEIDEKFFVSFNELQNYSRREFGSYTGSCAYMCEKCNKFLTNSS